MYSCNPHHWRPISRQCWDFALQHVFTYSSLSRCSTINGVLAVMIGGRGLSPNVSHNIAALTYKLSVRAFPEKSHEDTELHFFGNREIHWLPSVSAILMPNTRPRGSLAVHEVVAYSSLAEKVIWHHSLPPSFLTTSLWIPLACKAYCRRVSRSNRVNAK